MFRGPRARSPQRRTVALQLEALERRLTPARLAAPLIRLDLVALHEIGHALGLDHSNNPNSIMYPYINNNYNHSYFDSGNDPAVAAFRSLYSGASITADATPWQDDLDGSANDGVVALTYSFPADGTKLEQGNKYNNLAQTFGTDLTVAKDIIVAQLTRWASVSFGTVTFTLRTDNNQAFNVSGLSQNDPRIGDIRFGSHKFDSPGNVIAHAYFAPDVNSGTIAGDVHFASEETWVLTTSSGASSSGSASASSLGSNGSNLTLGNGRAVGQSTQTITAVISTAAPNSSVPAVIIVTPTGPANPSGLLVTPTSLAVPAPHTELGLPQGNVNGSNDNMLRHDTAISLGIPVPVAARKDIARTEQNTATPAPQANAPGLAALRTFSARVVDVVFADEGRRDGICQAGESSTPLLADGVTGTQAPLAAIVGLTVLLGGYWAAPEETRDHDWLRRPLR